MGGWFLVVQLEHSCSVSLVWAPSQVERHELSTCWLRRVRGVPDAVKIRRRSCGSEPCQKRQRVKVKVEGEGAIAKWPFEPEAHQVANDPLDVLLGDGRSLSARAAAGCAAGATGAARGIAEV